jgi:hypothetical protein
MHSWLEKVVSKIGSELKVKNKMHVEYRELRSGSNWQHAFHLNGTVCRLDARIMHVEVEVRTGPHPGPQLFPTWHRALSLAHDHFGTLKVEVVDAAQCICLCYGY